MEELEDLYFQQVIVEIYTTTWNRISRDIIEGLMLHWTYPMRKWHTIESVSEETWIPIEYLSPWDGSVAFISWFPATQKDHINF